MKLIETPPDLIDESCPETIILAICIAVQTALLAHLVSEILVAR